MTGDRDYEKVICDGTKGQVKSMCDVAERLKNMGRQEGFQEGRQEGQNILVDAVNRLRRGETPEQIIASGIDQKTVDLALTIK